MIDRKKPGYQRYTLKDGISHEPSHKDGNLSHRPPHIDGNLSHRPSHIDGNLSHRPPHADIEYIQVNYADGEPEEVSGVPALWSGGCETRQEVFFTTMKFDKEK